MIISNTMPQISDYLLTRQVLINVSLIDYEGIIKRYLIILILFRYTSLFMLMLLSNCNVIYLPLFGTTIGRYCLQTRLYGWTLIDPINHLILKLYSKTACAQRRKRQCFMYTIKYGCYHGLESTTRKTNTFYTHLQYGDKQ